MPGGNRLGGWGAAARSLKVCSMVLASGPASWLAMAATALRSRRPLAPPGRNAPKLASSTTASAWASTEAGSRWGPSEWAITSFSPWPLCQATGLGACLP